MDERDALQRDYWDSRAEAWANRDGMVERFTEDLGHQAMALLAPVAGERVLDVGCGPGTTTVDLAGRVGAGGEVVGLDIAPAMAAAGTRRAAAAGVTNARFVVHDLHEAPLDDGFDIVFSRFGVMFFSRPALAFSNLVASLRPGGRMGLVTWAPVADNPWMFVTNLAACSALGVEVSPPAPGAPGPFSLSDTEAVTGLLTDAGLADVAVQPCRGRLEVPAASARFEVASMVSIGPAADAYAAADAELREAVVDAVLAAAEPFRATAGWELPGCALVATGHRPA